MEQEGSESTAVINPNFFRRVASGLSMIYFYALSVMFYTANPEHDLEADCASSADDFTNSPTSTSPSITPSRISNFFRRSLARSRLPELPVLPVFQRSPESNHDQPNQTHLSNPIAQAFREVELGKAFLAFIMPIATILLTVAKKDLNASIIPYIFCLICVAFVSLFYGNLLRNIFPRIANAFEQFGTACIYTSFFLAVGPHLPPFLARLPYICFIACVLLSIYSCLPRGQGSSTM